MLSTKEEKRLQINFSEDIWLYYSVIFQIIVNKFVLKKEKCIC